MLTRRSAIASLGTAIIAGGIRPSRAQSVKIKVGEVLRTQFYTPMYVALGKGFVQEQGVEIELISAGGSDRVGALVLADGCDFGLAGPEVPVLQLSAELQAGSRLGWNTWLPTAGPRGDARDAVFEVEAI